MLKWKEKSIALICSTLMSFCSAAAPEDEYRALFKKRQLAKGYSEAQIEDFLKPAKKNEKVLAAIRKPWEAQPWYKYHPIFLTEERVAAGVTFWKKYHKSLQAAEKKFKVDAAVIVSIIGVETYYGRHFGHYNTRDALYSFRLILSSSVQAILG